MIKQSTLQFLTDLAANNNKAWFDANKKSYDAANKDIAAFVDDIIGRLTAVDGSLSGLLAKDSVFRIYRDVRFSHDKSPYKTNMGAWMARGGRKSPFAGYYLHIQPGGESFVAGGSYMPEANVLKSIRDSVDTQLDEFKAILSAKSFKQHFSNGLEGEKLKSVPKGYAADNPAAELLKHKSFIVSRKFTDEELTSNDFAEKAIAAYAATVPLTQFLNLAIAEVAQ